MKKGSVYLRGSVWWIAYYEASGVRRCISSGSTDKRTAEKRLASLTRAVAADVDAGARGETLAAYFEARWLPERKRLGHASQRDEEKRLRNYVLPVLGAMHPRDIDTRHVISVLRALRATELAPRTIRNIATDMRALFRDAVVDRVAEVNPCDNLRRSDLPPVRDADPSWRAQAVFTREELERLLLDPRIAISRRMDYAVAALTGARSGERFALRWKHYDAKREPLGCLAFEAAYSQHLKREKSTKTGVSRYSPVHPLLAWMLEEWRAHGWREENGRDPQPEDFLLPHAGKRRTHSVAWKGLQADLALLNLRERRVHDFRRTTISLALTDGAKRDVMESLTHPSPKRAFDLYLTYPWEALCAEVAKVRIAPGHPCYVAATSRARDTGFEGAAGRKPKATAGKSPSGGGAATGIPAHSRATERSSDCYSPEPHLDRYYAAFLEAEAAGVLQ